MCLLTCRHRLSNFLILFFVIDLSGALAWAQAPHNLILFIPDGLRPESVNVSRTPTFARVPDQGVRFANSHSVFPTLTMVNYLNEEPLLAAARSAGFLTAAVGKVGPAAI